MTHAILADFRPLLLLVTSMSHKVSKQCKSHSDVTIRDVPNRHTPPAPPPSERDVIYGRPLRLLLMFTEKI
jgi:hypothetical protein